MRREALDVHLVNDELLQREIGRTYPLPVERVVHDDALRHNGRVIPRVGRPVSRAWLRIVSEQQIVDVPELSGDGLGVWVEQQLRFVEPESPVGTVFTSNLVTVELAGPQPLDEHMPNELIAVLQLNNVSRLALRLVEEQKKNFRCVF